MRTQWGRVFLFLGAGMVVAFQVGKTPPALPILRADLGLSLYLAGWVLSSINVVGASVAPMAGGVSDWLGHRLLILFGLGSLMIGSLAGSFAGSGSMLLASRFVEGLGYISITVSIPGLLVRVVDHKDMRLAFGIWGAWLPAGAATMMFLAPLLIGAFGWRGVWRVNAGLLFAMLVWLAWSTRDLALPPADRRKMSLRKFWHDIWVTVKSPGPVLLALCFGCFAFQFLVVVGFLPTLLIEQSGLSYKAAAILSAVALLLNVPGNPLCGWLLQKGVKRWALIALPSIISSLCCFAIYGQGATLFLRYLGVLILMAVSGIIPSALIHGALIHAPSRELLATSNGILMQGSQIGLIGGPPIVAAVVSMKGNWQSAPWILLVVGLISVGLSLGLRAIEKRKTAAQV